MTVFSFHPVKHITTGEGGLVATDSLDFATRLRSFRNHGIDTEVRQRQARVNGQWHYEMTELGYNYRLSDIGCALGISQLRKLLPNISRRREIASDYKNAFAEIPEVLSLVENPDSESAWHIYPIRVDLEKLDGDRSDIFHALRAENIEVNVHYIPVHLHPYYRERFGYQGGEFPVAESAYEALITLPLYHAMTQQDEADVVEALTRVIRHYRRDI
jgi:perosamine synthetase